MVMSTILSAVFSFIATSIDYVIILVVLFSEFKKKKGATRDIALGQYAGITVLLVVSVLAAFGLAYVPQRWVGLLGFVPMYLGLKVWFGGGEDDEGEEEEIIESSHRFSKLALSVTAISLAAGGDNLGVYIPLFTTLNLFDLVLTIVIYYLMAAVLLAFSRSLTAIRGVSETVEKYEKFIVPVVFVALGFMILFENGTLVL
ncbi:CadD family cadmium resistance transporter [Sporolactobacillus sp. Y61]|uniref:CadD family cadmium resistance transporter n=1 Tax=Sporolactobacillus sp. Y61 TaxID=3160863 RepID=A0AAU8II92_9BACL|nr:CadD family cadmium resistance transporter [Sporolactobacillus sp. THM19-2]RYL94167.1 CadD family cadmium resistance transporter [Sporolactobacillus sp. THM19-2]